MLVYLHQYREDDAKETVRSDGDVDPDRDSSDYFDVDGLETDTWERVDVDGETLLRKAVSYDDVTAVSVPQDYPDEDGLPGAMVQLRTAGGETEYVDHAVVIEVQDATPE
ncbi:hypothetical protein [Halomarina rubra]|uniref:Uncharacterized protein n=1 Tax=Halomarina rubra TaxID=2071873 RepID=A0ABD6AYU8_9EURY|nr:hypothetical protein [Halomarina rubra]